MDNKKAKAVAKFLAIVLAVAMIAGVFLMFMPSMFAKGEGDDLVTEDKLFDEYVNEREKEDVEKYVTQIKDLIKTYKGKVGYKKAVSKLEKFIKNFDPRKDYDPKDVGNVIDEFRIDKSEKSKSPIFIGDETNLFRPKDNLTRAEFATIVLRLQNIEVPKSEVWYEAAMKKANELGFINGDENGFRPNDKVTLAEAITVFMRYLKLAPVESNSLGLPQNHWSRGFMERANIDGYLKRINDKFKPDRFIYRDELAALLTKVRTLDIDKEEIDEHKDELKTYKDVSKRNPYYYDIIENSN